MWSRDPKYRDREEAGRVLAANRTREIRPSGMKLGACGNVSGGRVSDRRTSEPCATGTHAEAARAVFLSQLRGAARKGRSYRDLVHWRGTSGISRRGCGGGRPQGPFLPRPFPKRTRNRGSMLT